MLWRLLWIALFAVQAHAESPAKELHDVLELQKKQLEFQDQLRVEMGNCLNAVSQGTVYGFYNARPAQGEDPIEFCYRAALQETTLRGY